MNESLTLPSDETSKTEETGETSNLSNDEFLNTVFGDSDTGSRPILVSFTGNPNKVGKSAWFGHPRLTESNNLASDANNYFSLATFRPNEAGQYRRKNIQFVALYAIVLDDIVGKIPKERMTLSPTWLLETSANNYQAGYLLESPLTDGGMADRLMKAIIAAELCDPGAGGPRARLARLPVGVNEKYDPIFQCRMTTWSPELKYSIEELISGLQLVMKEQIRPKRNAGKKAEAPPSDGDSIFFPSPEENAVLAKLKELSIYKSPLGGGKHDISCPWVNEHSGGVDSGTAYFEPEDNWPIGGFKCFHGHCADRNIRDLLEFFNLDIKSASMKSTIRVVAGEMHRVIDAAERELARTKRVYQRGGLIVTVVTDPGTRETRIQGLTQPSLVGSLSKVALWERFDCRVSAWIRCDPPARHTAVLFDSTSYPYLPVLNGLARQPYLRADGTMMSDPGYDSESGMFGVFDARAFCVPEMPTRQEAENSLEFLTDILSEFSFATKTDLAASLSSILTASIRPSLRTAPMFHVKAHTMGSGKSYLCELLNAFASPQKSTPTTFPSDDEECRKLLLAELLRSPAVIEFDNLTSDLMPHKSLCTALTSEHMSGRILGVSKTAIVDTRTLFLSSGNNVGPVQDMTRRCITIKLAPQCEIPAARPFRRPHLVQEVLLDRARYVSAALTIIRAWIVAGRPITKCAAMSGFEQWSEMCRQPLLWLGCDDPTVSIFESMAEDPNRESLRRLMDAWLEVFRMSPAMVREAVAQSYSHEELKEALYDIAGDRDGINRKKLGWWLKRHSGRIVEGKKIIHVPGNRSAEQWRVVVVDLVSPF